jgi:hypothetical protein
MRGPQNFKPQVDLDCHFDENENTTSASFFNWHFLVVLSYLYIRAPGQQRAQQERNLCGEKVWPTSGLCLLI